MKNNTWIDSTQSKDKHLFIIDKEGRTVEESALTRSGDIMQHLVHSGYTFSCTLRQNTSSENTLKPPLHTLSFAGMYPA